jgi:hypothetical protein
MKAQRFKPGQEVVCVKADRWSFSGPAFNQVCVIDGYFKDHGYDWNYVHLSGFTQAMPNGIRINFNDVFFEPLVSDAVLEKELSEIVETVTNLTTE